MREKLSDSAMSVAIAVVAGSVVVSAPITRAETSAASTPAPAASSSLKTPWGEPDLQGIWTDETTTPLQRPARYANQEVFSEAERAELDRVGRKCSVATDERSAGPSATSRVPITMCSCRSSALARGPRSLSIRPTAGFHR